MKRLDSIYRAFKIGKPSLRQEIAIEAHYVDLCLCIEQQMIPIIIEHSEKTWGDFNKYIFQKQREKQYLFPITQEKYNLVKGIFYDNYPLVDAFGKDTYSNDYAFFSGVAEFAYKQFIKDAETKPTKELYEEFINGDNGLKMPQDWLCGGEDYIPTWKYITYEVFEKLYKWSVNMLKYRDEKNFM